MGDSATAWQNEDEVLGLMATHSVDVNAFTRGVEVNYCIQCGAEVPHGFTLCAECTSTGGTEATRGKVRVETSGANRSVASLGWPLAAVAAAFLLVELAITASLAGGSTAVWTVSWHALLYHGGAVMAGAAVFDALSRARLRSIGGATLAYVVAGGVVTVGGLMLVDPAQNSLFAPALWWSVVYLLAPTVAAGMIGGYAHRRLDGSVNRLSVQAAALTAMGVALVVMQVVLLQVIWGYKYVPVTAGAAMAADVVAIGVGYLLLGLASAR